MKISETEYQNRIKNVRDILKDKNLDAAFVYYDELNIANGWYLSGWCPQFESGAVFVPKEGKPMILGGPESEPFAKTDSMITETRNIEVFMVPEEEYPNAAITNLKEIFKEINVAGEVRRVGLVGRARIPLGVYEALVEEFKGVELVDITGPFEKLREIKSEWERETMRKSYEICYEAYRAMREAVKPGVSELEVAAAAESKARALGANWFGFKTVVAAGERANGVVPVGTARRFKKGEFVLLSFGCRYKGYNASVGDTVVAGEPTAAQKEVLENITRAFKLTKDMLYPGKSGKEIDTPARRFFTEEGYIKYLVCPFAHTVGLYEAEAPFYGPNSNDVLGPGMCVSIDVSFFGHPEFYGVRKETGYEITEKGPKAFSPQTEEILLNP